ncbi:MAG: hypothetical protein Q9M25_01970 [Mariprofundaceae bacterium]|nr:hypothetical protein [Mariprofundaceae bacterium]
MKANMVEMSKRLALLVLVLLLIPACGAKIKTPAFLVAGSYESALRYFNNGEIMKARSSALRTDASRPDYQQAQTLLKKKIEPARLRLLRHYRRAAQKAEKRGVLYRAKELYLKTASLWLGDNLMQKNVARIDLIIRQRRINHLIVQRRKEDKQLLDALNRYNPPKGLNPKDKSYARERERLQNRLLARGRNAWRAAKRELREDHAEVAYVEAESYMRLRPGSRRAPLLMQQVREALPKKLRIPRRDKRRSSPSIVPKSASAGDIKQLMQQQKWRQAYEYATIYRREGGENADALLQTINKVLKKQAEAAFKAGQLAFRNERLDKAVEYWKIAAELQPDNRDYNDSLRRARELQERFRILQRTSGKTGK